MIDRLRSYFRPAMRLGQNERPLNHGLCVQRQAARRPLTLHAIHPHRLGNVRLQCCRMAPDTPLACLAQLRMRLVHLLHHRSHQAGELGQLPLQQRFPKIDVRQQPVHWILRRVVLSLPKQPPRHEVPVLGCRQRQLCLTLEVVEEAALRQPRRLADVLHPGRCISLGSNEMQRGVQQLSPRFVLCLCNPHVHTNQSVCTLASQFPPCQALSVKFIRIPLAHPDLHPPCTNLPAHPLQRVRLERRHPAGLRRHPRPPPIPCLIQHRQRCPL
jgi:hypothetical protein